MNLQSSANVFKALCDEKRLSILQLLLDGECCACVLMDQLDFTQSGLSYHMKILCESGIVKGRREGKWVHYSIDKQACIEASELLLKLTGVDGKIEKTRCCCKEKE